MTLLKDLAAMQKSVFCLWILMLIFGTVITLVYGLVSRRKKESMFLSVGLLAAESLLYQSLAEKQLITGQELFRQRLGNVPWIVILAVSLGLALILCRQIQMELRLNRESPSQTSIQEGIEELPTGVCWYEENGIVRLSNEQMRRLAKGLTGQSRINAEKLWRSLTANECLPGNTVLRTGERPLVELSDGSVIEWERNMISSGDGCLYEITAVDVTNQVRIHEALTEKTKELSELNERQRELGKTIQAVTIEKEVLQAKIRIHDDLGAALTASVRYLASEDTEDRESLQHMWQDNIHFLEKETEGAAADEIALMWETAENIGMTIEVTGEIPEDKQIRKITAVAMHECMTNTVRHAGGDRLYLSIEEDAAGPKKLYHLQIRSNGRQPEGPIEEKGGLKLLRKLVEHAGGLMRIETDPEYVVKLVLKG